MRALDRNDVRDTYADESAEELYENAPCGYITTLPNGTIVRANRTFLEWMGYQREELLNGKRFQELLTVGGKLFHETHYAPLLRLQGAVHEINFELVTKNGRKLPFLVNSVHKKDSAGRPVLTRTTLFNITDRKNYERELLLARKKAQEAEQAARARADFVSIVSHEIRTPMNAIIGLAQLLIQTRLSAEQEKYLNILQSSSENLLSLVNNILDFSKIEASKLVLEERRFDLRQLTYGIFYGLNIKAEQKGLAVRVELDEQLPTALRGDPVKLGQVLTNLLANAIKFTEQGSVTLAARVRQSTAESVLVEFRVTDTGIGIPRDRQAQIFEEFTQASYDIHLKYGGTGLGLAICQKLLALYDTRLDVESEPGVGSSFSFSLPLKVALDEQPSQESTGKHLSKERSLQGLRVLVAEDNTVNVFVLSQFLRTWGVDFEVVEDGAQAVARVQQASYDLVLMDLQMPGLDGYGATRAIRALPRREFGRLPIIALTASTRLGNADAITTAGFTDYIGKPFKPDHLFSKLALYGARPQAALAQGAESPPEASPSEPAAARPRFNLDNFRNMAEGDPHALREFNAIVVHNAEQSKKDFQEALSTGDLEAFDFFVHKLKMTLELLQAHVLSTALSEGQRLLLEKVREPARLQTATLAIHTELDAIILALKAEA
ncbi:MAG TPA: ATP-binding protein [Myxococcaceae bacterium]|nr:ATP-binding protein [Myxococcaceae bacterium]